MTPMNNAATVATYFTLCADTGRYIVLDADTVVIGVGRTLPAAMKSAAKFAADMDDTFAIADTIAYIACPAGARGY